MTARARSAARAVLAVGLAALLVGVFLDPYPIPSYWSLDENHLRAVFLLVLGLACARGLTGRFASNRPGLDFAAITPALIALGFTLYLPIHATLPVPGSASGDPRIGAGVAIALAGSLLFASGALAAAQTAVTFDRRARPSRREAIVLIGVLTLAGSIWLEGGLRDQYTEGSSYWQAGKGLFLLLLALVCAIAVLGKLLSGRDAFDRAVHRLGLVAMGFALNPVLGAAFGDWADLRAGAWLALAGSILIVGATTQVAGEKVATHNRVFA